MLSRIDSQQFTNWMAFYRISPFGEDRADLRMGIMTSNLINLQVKRKTRPIDFMPYAEKPKETIDSFKAKFKVVKHG